jgi:hypothetical protein
MGASICHVQEQTRDAVGAWNPRSSVYGQFVFASGTHTSLFKIKSAITLASKYGISVSRYQSFMQPHSPGYRSSRFVSDDSLSSYSETGPYIILSGVRTCQVQV